MPKDKTHHRGQSFFSSYPDPAKTAQQPRVARYEAVAEPAPKKKRLHNVGGQGDCGFRALAAGMVDNIIANGRLVHVKPNQELSRANQEFCGRLLQQHLERFPHYNEEIGEGLWTPIERLERMRHKQGFIPDLAYTLRQAAVDEIVQHPEDYRGAFVEHPEQLTPDDQQTSPMHMRELGTWIDESAIAAVAKVFNVPVIVRVTAPNQELFKPLHYGPDVASPVTQANQIEIRLENQHYQPMLANPKDFATVASQSAFTQQASASFEYNDPSLSEMLVRVKAADEKLVEEFSDHKARLTELVSEGQLDKEKLLAIYIQGMGKQGNSGYLEGRVRQVGLEYGSQDFFANAIKNIDSDMSSTRSDPNDVFEMIIVEELVHAIARAMTINDLSPKDVYEQIASDTLSVAPRS